MKNISIDRYCPSCFAQRPQRARVCPACSYEEKANEPEYLPVRTLIYDRYLIGTVAHRNRSVVVYNGLDLVTSQRVEIREFFPVGAAVRAAAPSVAVIAVEQRSREFHQGLQRFSHDSTVLAQESEKNGTIGVVCACSGNGTFYLITRHTQDVAWTRYASKAKHRKEDAVIRMIEPVISALKGLHHQGVVHGNICPDNLLMQEDGTLRMSGWMPEGGTTAQRFDCAEEWPHGYLPQECYVAEEEPDAQTDVYGLCASVYYGLTKDVPACAETRGQTDPLVPLHERNKKISQQTANAVEKGMAVNREERFANVDELEASFREATNSLELLAKKRRKKALVTWAVAAMAVLAIGTVGLVSIKLQLEIDSAAAQREREEVDGIVGLSEEVAIEELEKEGLYVTVQYAAADGAHAGKVLLCERTSEQSVLLTVGELTQFLFEENKDGLTITGHSGDVESLQVPQTINAIAVTEIGAYAFAESGNEKILLESVYVPEGVLRIGEGAFDGCNCLNKAELPDTILSVGYGAFRNCTSLKTNMPASLETVGAYAFQYCFSFDDIILPDGCKEIGDQAFEGCLNAERIVLPASITKIGAGAFTSCIKATLEVEKDSYAHSYAQIGTIPYVIK